MYEFITFGGAGMKVCMVCYPTHGGSGVIASELAVGLAASGHEIHIVSYATPFRLGSFHQNIFIHEVEVASYPLFKYPPYTLGLATKLAEVASDEQLDIIHAHYAVPHAVSAFLAREIIGEGAPKIVTTLHGTDITLVGADESFHRVTRFAMQVSDAVTAVSQYLKRRTNAGIHPITEISGIPQAAPPLHNLNLTNNH